MQTLLHDVRYGVRLLRRSPAFAATAMLTLALAIGANTAVFSAVKGVLIAPLPYPDPDRLVRLFEEAATAPHFPMAPNDFRDYRAELRTFEGLAAYIRNDLQIADGGRAEQLRAMQVTSGFFKVLGYSPTIGREFEPADELAGSDDVVVLSQALWLRRFSGDPSIVGRPIRLSGRTFKVIGVLPPGFQHVGGTYRTYRHGEAVDAWWVLRVPRDEQRSDRFSHYFNVVGRTRTDATPAAVAEDLRATSQLVAKRYPSPNSPWSASMTPLKEEIVGSTESTLVALSGAATLVLVLACVNVAGLLLGRSAGRAREMGVRAALGATRGRLARQLLIETLVLAAAGGALGTALAFVAVRALAAYGPADIPRLQMISVDRDVLAYALAATMVSALLSGFAPALQLAQTGLGDTLKKGGRTVAGSVHQRTRRVLAAAQVALAFVLVVSGGLLLRSFASMINADPGFRPASALTAALDLPAAKYDSKSGPLFYDRVLTRVRALPGVSDAAFGSDLPWTGYDENTSFSIVGRQYPRGEGPAARYHFVTPAYPRATGTPLVAGRDLGASDGADAPLVVLMNESAARKYWKTADAAVGARLNVWGKERTIAGVVGDVRDMPWHDAAVASLYFPQAQTWYPQRMFLIVRAGVEPLSLVDPIRRAVSELDPELPLSDVRPLDQVAGAALSARRLILWLVATFGASALLLAVVGIYGVMAQSVGQRAHEFGVRQALGATRADVMRLVLSGGALITGVGLGAGVLLSFGSTRLLRSLLFGVSPSDPATFAAVAVLLAAAAGAAAYVPARRATRISAAIALRSTE
jgi:putative ABC transport system permease protein